MAAAPPPPSVVGIQKNASKQTVEPGDSFSYQLTPSCSGITAGCVDMTVTDTIPAGLDVDVDALLAQSSPPDYTITYDPATRQVKIVYGRALDNPEGTTGWPAGSVAPQISIPVTVPEGTTIPSGTVVTNTATNVAVNAPPVDDSASITIRVPAIVKPTLTKDWADGSAVAGTGEASTITLNVKNQSTSSTQVSELSVSDTTADTFENFDFTGATVTRFPDGADRAALTVTLADGSTATGPPSTPPPPVTLALPPGVNPADVVGFEVSFTNSAGTSLPYDATGGTVEVGMQLRDTKRSDGTPLRPTDKVTVDNCATPTATDAQQGPISGPQACASYDILPDVLVLNSTKTFFPDTNGNWVQEPGEHAVIDQDSAVSTVVDVQNRSPFPIREIVITEPDPNSASELAKLDIDQVRLRFPEGATQGVLSITCRDGSTPPPQTYTSSTTVDVSGQCPTGVASVTVTYTGVDADGNPTIAPNATAGLDLHGMLNSSVDENDLPGGSNPGITNCAGFTGDAGRTDGSGTASGSSCAVLPIEEPFYAGDGTKTSGQTSVPPGQPIPFHIEVTNASNVPIVNPVISDPRVGPDGKPDPAYSNPFDVLRITSISVVVTPALPFVVELYDPSVGSGTWVAYDPANAALLERARGFRIVVTGSAPPLAKATIDVVTQRRDGVPDDVEIENCVSTGVIDFPNVGDPFCSPTIITEPASASASLNKSISPGQLPRFVPGLPKQLATVDLTIVNTGNLSAKQLQVTDNDTDFFDAVDFVSLGAATFPAGADLVQVDAFVNGSWVDGAAGPSAVLPAGVNAEDVRGIRATFTSTNPANQGYVITPCETPISCAGHVPFVVSPRQFLRSAPTTPIPDNLENTVEGQFTTLISPTPVPIPPTSATLQIVVGSPKIAVDKSPDSEIAPGQSAPFYLKVTNTGTNNVHDLTVDDVLPPGIAFDAAFVGDNGQPFKIINTQVPDGTPPVPFPTLTTTNDGARVSRLSFDFSTQTDGQPWLFAPGATLTIQIQVGLEPGVTAGQVLTNTMGATGSDDSLACDGASDPQDLFGPGTWCTDDARLTVRSGASFAARKWVAGRASLGWYNTLGGVIVGLGNKSCPSTLHDGRLFTAYPCVALVDPGDTFSYLLELQNAGTEPGRDMRIIDRFPVVGDKGVFVDLDRGTEWQNRPTLASAPVLDGPGSLTTTYTNSEPLCTEDLKMGGVGGTAPQCPAGAWADPFGASAVAAQMRVHFDPLIPPGGTVNITFDMRTPLDVPRVSDPTTAWNSYAHAEVTDRSGAPNVLPVTEPVKVGVATAYGTLRLDKVIGENPNDLPLGTIKFDIHVVCTLSPQGGTDQTVLDQTYPIAADDPPLDITGIPAGAVCTVTEPDPKGGLLPDPVTVTIRPSFGDHQEIVTATITNNFPDAIIELTKVVTGPGQDYAPDAFPVDVYCTFGGQPVDGFNPLHVELTPTEPRFQADVPAGAECYAVETDSGGAVTVTYDPPGPSDGQSGSVTTANGDPQEITITNDYQTGGIVVNKQVAGAGAPSLAQGPFTFHVACTFNGQENAFEADVTIPRGDGSQTTFTSPLVDGIPAGPTGNETTCVVTETDNGGADATPPPVQVTIIPGQDVLAEFTSATGHANPFSAGTIGLVKDVDGDLADAPWVQEATFTVLVTCQLDTTDASGEPVRATVYSNPVEIQAGQSIAALPGPNGEPVLLPVGTHCFGEETGTGGATSHDIDYDSFDNAAVVVAQSDPEQPQALTLTATNTFDQTSLALTKEVVGAGADQARDRTFTLAVSCVLDQGGDQPTALFTAEPLTIGADETVVVDGLPVGAQCWATETDTGGAQSSTVDHDSAETAVTLRLGETTEIVVVNRFAATGGSMPRTGATVAPSLLGGGLAVMIGLALVLGSRRRKTSAAPS